MNILFFATAWGPLLGGVNAFNRSLAFALARRLQQSGLVFCVALDPDEAAIGDAAGHGVTLIPVRGKPPADRLDSSWILDVQEALDAAGGPAIDLCLGHDVISGEIAVRAAPRFGARSGVIHHMDYRSYHGAKGEPGRTDAISQDQARILPTADLLFAVGPLLADSARRIAPGKTVVELIPGLEAAPPQTSTNGQLEAITFGRFDAPNRIIKQAGLAAAGFGRAARRGQEQGLQVVFDGAPLYVIGTDAEDERRELSRLADEAAGRVVNVIPLPFTPDPAEVLRRLAGCNAALVLSLHEGFSLAAWEAIASGTPLILTRNSGVYRLIHRDIRGSGLGCLRVVDIQGQRGAPYFTVADEAAVADALLKIARDIPGAKADALELRTLVRDRIGATWPNAAQRVLEAFGGGSGGGASPRSGPRGAAATPPLPERAVSTSILLENPVSACADMSVTPTQGSHALAYDLTPEVRFGRYEFTLDGVEITCGVRRADLTVEMEGCEIPPGPRLGDSAATAPHIISEPPSRWRIEGPLEDGLLARRALGSERLCDVRMKGTGALVTLTVSCRSRDLDIRFQTPKWPRRSPTQEQIMKVFLAKCLAGGGDAGMLLSRATLQLRTDEE